MELPDMLWNWVCTNWFGALCLFLGLIPTIIVYRWQRKDKRPYYSRRTTVIIANAKEAFPAVAIHYKGHADDIDSLSATVFAVWNAGRATLDKNDVVLLKPLSISTSQSVKLLGASIIQTNNATCGALCTFKKTSNSATLTFDFLDCCNGFVVEVLHTGINYKDIKIEGAFKECGDIREYDERSFLSKFNSLMQRRKLTRRSLQRSRGRLMVCYGVILALIVCIGTIYDYNHKSFDVVCIEGRNYGLLEDYYRIVQQTDGMVAYKPMRPSYVYLLIVMSLALINVYIGWRFFKSGIPSGLDKFDDHIL